MPAYGICCLILTNALKLTKAESTYARASLIPVFYSLFDSLFRWIRITLHQYPYTQYTFHIRRGPKHSVINVPIFVSLPVIFRVSIANKRLYTSFVHIRHPSAQVLHMHKVSWMHKDVVGCPLTLCILH